MVQGGPKLYFTNGIIENTSESYILKYYLHIPENWCYFTKWTSGICYTKFIIKKYN